ncbi:MAG: NADPH:quinone oxidoreductase family protein [Myxococcota bacterium]
MRAALITDTSGPDAIEVREIDTPVAKKGHVVVEVAACGVNFPDLLMSRGMYQFKPPLPFAPGGELAGTITEVGEGVSNFAVGDRVMALNWFGGFATHALVAERLLVRVPDEMDLETAGAFAFTYATSYHALVDRAQLAKGERLLVLGAAGGVGLAAVEIGAALGAEVVAAASTEEKLELCRAHGATKTINYSDEDLKKAAKAAGGIDVVYDPVGGAYSEAALRALRPNGRLLVIGFAAGEIPSIRLNLVLLKQCQLVGVAWGSWAMANGEKHQANIEALFALWREGKVKPHVSKRYRLEEAAQALRDMDERKVKGKVVITPAG